MHRHIVAAAAAHVPLVAAAARLPLTRPTPCSEWDLQDLLGHLLYWTPVLAEVGRRSGHGPADGPEPAAPVTGDWPVRLHTAREDLVAVWSEPAAWDGTVTMGEQVPAAVIGGMVLGELVVHGWDLGRAVGVDPQWPAEVLDATLTAVSAMAEQGQGMGVFAPAVEPGPGATPIERIVALTGRDPGCRR
ncbi:TIGR03086 family metal-binding protein [Pseudonocardia sp. ICBG1034]|uniref:TIGR03086 family metal-binding protein n=1 Tax=Pseudonocardia sp. ICBG1034 TaxID=2844381 RepID=UPI001CCB09D0|nr:TIGR03086 family metal-binding protein [Pseudonocardia sp. ICBG1034]